MNAVRFLRLAGMLEGVSFLVLLLIAMPLKYFFAYPEAVRVVGMTHGLLFVVFLFALFRAHVDRSWSARTSLSFLVAALLPFGFLVIDKRLRSEITLAGQNA